MSVSVIITCCVIIIMLVLIFLKFNKKDCISVECKDPISIIEKRYADGEITHAEYIEIKKDIDRLKTPTKS